MADASPLLEVVSPCVGREAELTRLRALAEQAARAARGHVVFVSGPAGVGKSALVGELRRRVSRVGGHVMAGQCRAGAAPYAAVADLVDDALALLGEAGVDAGSLARHAETAALLRGRGERPPGAPGGASGRLWLFERTAELLRAAGAITGAVICLQDLHHADDATAALVDYLLRNLAPAPDLGLPGYPGLIVVTTRAEAAPAAELAATHLPLPGLDREGVRAFLTQAQHVERLLAVSSGLPQVLEALLARPAPDPAQKAAEALAALSAGARRVALLLAVLGRPAGARLLARLGASREDLVEAGGSALCERRSLGGELHLSVPAPDPVLYRVGAEERVGLHRALGEALAALAPPAGTTADGAEAAEVAHHLLRGSAGEAAVDAALVAGDALERAFAFERVDELYSEALAATRRPAIAELLAERLSILRELAGDYDRALDAARHGLEARPEDPARRHRVGHLQLLRGDLAAAREALGRAADLAAQRGDRTTLARALADGAEAHFLSGAFDRALADGQAALRIAEGDEALLAPRIAARNSIGKVHLGQGDYEQAARCFAANLTDARRAGLLFEVARAHVNLGIAAIRRGDDAGAEASYRAGLAAAIESGDPRHRAFCLQNLGVLAQWRRDYAEALALYQEAVAAFMRLGHRPHLAWVAIDLGDLYLGLGALDHAASMAEWAARIGGDALSPTAQAILAHLRGRLALERGEPAAARAELSRALTIARAAESPDEASLALLSLARLELVEGDARAALAHLDALPAPPSRRSEAAAALARGEALFAAGQLAEAAHMLTRADAAFAALADEEGRLRAALVGVRVAERRADGRTARRLREVARALDARLKSRVPAAFAGNYGKDPLRLEVLGGAAAGATFLGAGPAGGPLVAAGSPALRHGIVGSHPRLLHVLDLVERVAPRDALVLIRGESGTGKELVAEAIHRRSPRGSRPFIKVNCAALVDTLLLSELFGHERGAFTGALTRKKGRFELADGGTLFLDEIGDISPQTQVALLRVLQTQEFERVGGTQPIRVDVRIVCATNRDLEDMVRRGQFREDLYYRLQGLELALPPLRERPSDLPALARHFLERAAAEQGAAARPLTPAAEARLAAYRWPGNIRELENVMRSVSLFCDGEVIDEHDLADYLPIAGALPAAPAAALAAPAPAAAPTSAGSPADLSDIYERAQGLGLSLRELKRRIEKECITRALAEASGNITRAAEILRMKRPRLSQLLKEHGIAARSAGPEVE